MNEGCRRLSYKGLGQLFCYRSEKTDWETGMVKETARISVRSLVEFILRNGDLDERGGSMDRDAMQKGSRLHRKIQKSMGSGYQAEVPLKKEIEYDDLILVVEGRADGIFESEGLPWIDEIKGLVSGFAKLSGPVPVHLAQAKCYALIHGENIGAERIGVQMTYGDLETEETIRFREEYDLEELKQWFRKLADAWHRWEAWHLAWKKERNASALSLEFPFSYREGQRKVVGTVYHAIGSRRQLFLQAPTGIGKTISTVFPASGRRKRRDDLLPDRQDDHPDSSGRGVFHPDGQRPAV